MKLESPKRRWVGGRRRIGSGGGLGLEAIQHPSGTEAILLAAGLLCLETVAVTKS